MNPTLNSSTKVQTDCSSLGKSTSGTVFSIQEPLRWELSKSCLFARINSIHGLDFFEKFFSLTSVLVSINQILSAEHRSKSTIPEIILAT